MLQFNFSSSAIKLKLCMCSMQYILCAYYIQGESVGFFPISSQGVRNFTSCRRRRHRRRTAASAVAALPSLRCRRRAAVAALPSSSCHRRTAAAALPSPRCCDLHRHHRAALYCRAVCHRAVYRCRATVALPPQLVESFCCLLQFKPTDTTRVYFAGAELNYSVSAQRAEYQKKTSAKVGFHL